MLTIERLEVLAELDDPERIVKWASDQAAAGDESWAQWLRDYERGAALVVRLSVSLFALDGRRDVIELTNDGVFIEKDVHPARLEQQIARHRRQGLRSPGHRAAPARL